MFEADYWATLLGMHIARALILSALALFFAMASTSALAQDPSTTTTAAGSATLPISNDAVEVQQDIPYYEGGPVLDAYLPKNGQTKRPALVMVHGGGWNSGDKAEFAPYAMRAATEQQWAVFDVDYLTERDRCELMAGRATRHSGRHPIHRHQRPELRYRSAEGRGPR